MTKRLGVAFLTICMHAVLAQAATNVASQNAVGYVRVDLPGDGLNFVALNFRAVGGGPLTLSELFGTNQLKQSGFFTLADQVLVYSPTDQGYESYFQKPDGFFYNTKDTSAAVDPELPPGQSFWLKSGAGPGNTNSIFLMGEVVGSETVSQPLYEGLNPLSLPYATDYALTNKNWVAEGATGSGFFTLADQIAIWNGIGYDVYFLKTDGKWYKTTDPSVPVDVKIPVGVGAWYTARTAFTSENARVYSYPAD